MSMNRESKSGPPVMSMNRESKSGPPVMSMNRGPLPANRLQGGDELAGTNKLFPILFAGSVRQRTLERISMVALAGSRPATVPDQPEAEAMRGSSALPAAAGCNIGHYFSRAGNGNSRI